MVISREKNDYKKFKFNYSYNYYFVGGLIGLNYPKCFYRFSNGKVDRKI